MPRETAAMTNRTAMLALGRMENSLDSGNGLKGLEALKSRLEKRFYLVSVKRW
jgi:hypothetical protein